MRGNDRLTIIAAALAVFFGLLVAATASAKGRALSLTKVATEPSEGRTVPTADELSAMREKVAAEPKDRRARFALVHGLMRSGDLDGALTEAVAWRKIDAYNLVVVRMLGDIYAARGDKARALRTYSAVVELLPEDPAAQRALASVLKQQGHIAAAYDRIAAAAALRQDDHRLAFELADAAHRLGRLGEAARRFDAIATADGANDAIRYPAKQRLAQVLGEQRNKLARGSDKANAIGQRIAKLDLDGGAENDIKVYLTWDTDRSDVDLWVTSPDGEKVSYEHKKDKHGATLFRDVTTGFGPESYTAHAAQPGTYVVEVNYYGAGRGNFAEARGEVVVVLGEGRPNMQKHVLPYRMFSEKQTVTVARIAVQ